MAPTIVFTGGGTAGHVFPGLAVVDEIRTFSDARIVWIGSKHGIERALVEERGIQYFSIPTGKLRRYLDLENVVDIFRVLAGVIASVFILSRLKPGLLFSKGGFVSVPPLVAARLLGVPSITHESDRDPGLATKIAARLVQEVLLAYPEARTGLPRNVATTITGNPVRRAIYEGNRTIGRQILGVGADRTVLFFVGGSSGARQINELVLELLPRLKKEFFVVHQCGPELHDTTEDGYYRRSFIRDEYPDLLHAADLVISRAGANSLWEIAAVGKPAVLIPLSAAASRGDQLRNAAAFGETGCAVVLDSAHVNADILYDVLADLGHHRDRLQEMASHANALGKGDAARAIAERLFTVLGNAPQADE